MRISNLAVRRPITTLMLFICIVVLGVVSYFRLPIQLLPDIDFPTIVVQVTNAKSAEENLESVTKKVEGIISEVPRVKRIRSFTSNNYVRFRIDLEYGADLQYTTVDLQERLVSFQQSTNDRRMMINAFPFSTASFQATFMMLSVKGTGDLQALFRTTQDKVEQQLQTISGVANVEVYGLIRPEIEVDLKPDLLSSYKLDLGQVISRVQAVATEDTFLGRLKVPGETWYVRVNDKVRTLDELGNIIVDNLGVVRLRDVATVADRSSVDRWVSRSDGKNSINISMERESGRNMIDLARLTRKRVEEINRTLPPGVELKIEEDLAEYVEKAISNVKKLAGQGALLALVVPLLFFRSIRVALIVFISVPICLIAVFNLFYAFGMTINIFSIVGLALGVGMLVDNSIVVTENALRHFQLGATPPEAAARGGVEVGRGLFASTLTTAVVFVPIAFLDGEFKMIVKEPTLALIFPLLLSLLVALTLVPVFVRSMLETMKRRPSTRHLVRTRMVRAYSTVLKGALRYRARVLFLIAVVLTITWMESCQRIKESATSQEASREWMEVYYEAPRGSTLSNVNLSVVQLEQRLVAHPNIKSFSVSFNNEGGRVSIRLKELKDRQNKESFREIQQSMLDFIGEIQGLQLSLQRFGNPLSTPSVALGTEGVLELKGLDPLVLNSFAERLIEALQSNPQITGARIKDDAREPIYLAKVDRDKSRQFDIKSEQIGRYVGATRSGGTISTLQLVDGENRTNVSFVISEAEGGTLEDTKRLELFSPISGRVQFGELSTFEKSLESAGHRRTDRQSSKQLAYYYTPDANASLLGKEVKRVASTLPNPAGVVVAHEGEAQRIDERQGQFFFVLIAGAVLVYVVMAAVFESFWVPFVILATNPLMLIGIVWGLDIFGLPLDDLAAFGVILLVGLAVNNGIVMMDRALEMQRAGFRRTRAIYEASLTRLRPIVMTYLTTVLGLLPMALVGEDSDQWRPVAVVIIGGLSSATILTLVVLPCFYLIGDDFVRWVRAPFLNLLAGIFELFESISNLFFHPVQVLKGRLPFAPKMRAFLWSVVLFGWNVLKVPASIIWQIPSDIFFFLFRFFGISKRTCEAKTPNRLVRLYRRISDLLHWARTKTWTLLKRCWRGLYSIPGRAYRLLFKLPLLRRFAPAAVKPTEENPSRSTSISIQVPLPESAPSPLQVTNIQVIYPASLGNRFLRKAASTLRLRSRTPSNGVHALAGITLTMETGLIGLLGPNGAGKTTLLRCIAGLQEPTRGSVRLFGSSHREAPSELAPLVGYLPQKHGHYDWMTLYQYLDYFCLLTAQTLARAKVQETTNEMLTRQLDQLYRLLTPEDRHQAILKATAEVNLTEVLEKKLGSFSGGMKQRAGIARILLQAPPILVVDEPTAGLDPIERVKVRLLLSRLARGRLVIFSTHIVEDLEQNCSQVAILDQGHLLCVDSPAQLRAHWEGKIWEVTAPEGTSLHTLREELFAQGIRILFQIVRDGREGFRVLSDSAPTSTMMPVVPTLEDMLLGMLGPRFADRLKR